VTTSVVSLLGWCGGCNIIYIYIYIYVCVCVCVCVCVSPEVTTVTVGGVQTSEESVFTATGSIPDHVFVCSSLHPACTLHTCT